MPDAIDDLERYKRIRDYAVTAAQHWLDLAQLAAVHKGPEAKAEWAEIRATSVLVSDLLKALGTGGDRA